MIMNIGGISRKRNPSETVRGGLREDLAEKLSQFWESTRFIPALARHDATLSLNRRDKQTESKSSRGKD